MRQVFCVKQKDLEWDDVGSLRAFRSLLNLELYLLSFVQVLKTISLNCAEVDEYIRAILAFNEAITFASVEPFDYAGDTF
jgi:hypothetical protein